MDIVTVEKDGMKYEAEYFSDDEMVTVYGNDGVPANVVINGMSEINAARSALRQLINMNQISAMKDD